MCGSPPDAPKLPQFPGLTPEETAILEKQGISLEQFNQLIQGTGTSLAQNKQVLQQISGLYDAQGNIDQNALNDLKTRTQGQLVQAQGVGSAALGYLQNYFGGSGGGAGGTGTPGVAQTQADVYKTALEGTGAVNEATKQAQQRNFIAMKDSLAQRGIMVNGDTPEQATSDSTAGQRAIQLFQQNLAAQNSSERLGYIATLGGQVGNTAGQAGSAAGMGNAATNQAVGYVNNAATTSATTMAPLLGAYQQGLSAYYQPYQTQQLGPYQQQLDQAQMNYTAGLNQYTGFNSLLSSYLNPLGTLGGFAALKGVGGAGAAGAAGGAAAGGSNLAVAGLLV